MYHFGGIYTDLDFLCIRPFESFLKHLKGNKLSYSPNTIESPSIILSEEWLNSMTFTNTLHNGILVSLIPKHPFWLKLVHEIYDNVVHLKQQPKNNVDVFQVAGPKKLCAFYLENKHFFKDICVLPYYYFCPYICIENNERKFYNNAMVEESFKTPIQWVFFNIQDNQDLISNCPNSFFVCVYLNSGSMWK
jgi:hypothetical protein